MIQQLSRSLLAENVLVVRTDAGAVASGDLVPQSGRPFSNTALYGNYTESLGGTIGGNAFGGVCNDFFNGNGGVSGSCTLNTATVGKCQFRLSGTYGIQTQGGGFNTGTLTPLSGSQAACVSMQSSEELKIISVTSNGSSAAGKIAAVSLEPGVVATGTYLPQQAGQSAFAAQTVRSKRVVRSNPKAKKRDATRKASRHSSRQTSKPSRTLSSTLP